MAPVLARVAADWHRLTGDFGADPGPADTQLASLLTAYTAPARHYHDIRHIDALLRLSEGHRTRLTDRAAVDFAIFYHDAIYDPSRHDNEAASAALARESLLAMGAPASLVDKVARYAEATDHATAAARHAPGGDPDLDHLIDFDLSILGAEPHDYDRYATAIRLEYAIYPDAAYASGRAKVLRHLLTLPALYRVPAHVHAWTPRARANLERELAALSAA